jgi:hypothetical protein
VINYGDIANILGMNEYGIKIILLILDLIQLDGCPQTFLIATTYCKFSQLLDKIAIFPLPLEITYSQSGY